MPHFAQDSVRACTQSSPLEVSQADYPWLSANETTIPTFLVTLNDGTKFRFGSLIGLNGTVEKIAKSVAQTESMSTQAALFMGLPNVLKGQPASGIIKVENSSLPRGTLFVASRNLVTAAGLIFAIQRPEITEPDQAIVLRAGISTAKLRPRLLEAMGIRQAGGKRRQS